ncbi:MAG: hypothetical protein ACRC2T_07205, partial [Thermoguttaceae bacterium]
CPDPDTTEDEQLALSNLARLRSVLPLCDVIVVTGTQQKYRSRKVADELTDAAPGARLVFVQTNADRDADIREDWKKVLEDKYETGTIFFVDSTGQSREKSDDNLDALRNLLTNEMNEEHAVLVRSANYFDLAEETVTECLLEVDSVYPAVKKLHEKIDQQRQKLGLEISEKTERELIRDRRLWEGRLLERLTIRWGYSPFSLVLRAYQRLGSFAMGMALARARSIPQLAALGAVEGVRNLRKWSRNRRIKELEENVPLDEYWDETALREINLVLAGFAGEAKLPEENIDQVYDEAKTAGTMFTQVVAKELDSACNRLTDKIDFLPIRLVYETLVSVMMLFVFARPAYNFFYESFQEGKDIWPLSNYMVSVFWLLAWCGILLGIFLYFLYRALEQEIEETSQLWSCKESMEHLFSTLDSRTESVDEYRQQLMRMKEKIDVLNEQGRSLDEKLGRRIISQ